MTILYAPIAFLILLVVYWVRGPKYALAALLMLGGLYAALAWRIATSM